ncbi:MAG TPA: hypothetical protein VK184_22215 [Nostocaceae cyanobacterium]|nr:hypothetical protein [Nostocaceae cyanobacterium]
MNKQPKKETELENITNHGFNVEESSDKDIDLAFLSLKIALKAYFSTYHCHNGLLNYYIDNKEYFKDDDLMYCDLLGKSILAKYCEAYTECIIHFHHFAELVCKNFLRHDNPLFVISPSDEKNIEKNILLKYKIVKNQLSLKDENDMKTITFLDSLKALLSLIKAEEIKNDYYQKLSFIEKHEEMLKKLNTLRNIVWHRGLYILYYEALDKLVGKYILPFVDEVTKHEKYSVYENLWNHTKIDCGINPIKEIINHFKEGYHNMEKIALVKELGRAAYNIPSCWYSQDKKEKEAIENKALAISKNSYDSEIAEIDRCPVCGFNSLIIYKYVEYEVDQNDVVYSETPYCSRVKCECCSFELHNDIRNASEYGIEGIRDYWV